MTWKRSQVQNLHGAQIVWCARVAKRPRHRLYTPTFAGSIPAASTSRTVSSVVERFLHTEEVAGSKPAQCTGNCGSHLGGPGRAVQAPGCDPGLGGFDSRGSPQCGRSETAITAASQAASAGSTPVARSNDSHRLYADGCSMKLVAMSIVGLYLMYTSVHLVYYGIHGLRTGLRARRLHAQQAEVRQMELWEAVLAALPDRTHVPLDDLPAEEIDRIVRQAFKGE